VKTIRTETQKLL